MEGYKHTRFSAPARTPGNGPLQHPDREDLQQKIFNVLATCATITFAAGFVFPDIWYATFAIIVTIVAYFTITDY